MYKYIEYVLYKCCGLSKRMVPVFLIFKRNPTLLYFSIRTINNVVETNRGNSVRQRPFAQQLFTTMDDGEPVGILHTYIIKLWSWVNRCQTDKLHIGPILIKLLAGGGNKWKKKDDDRAYIYIICIYHHTKQQHYYCCCT